MLVLAIILKIIGWIFLVPSLLLYGFIESFLDLGIELKHSIKIQNIVRLVFITIITLLSFSVLGFLASGMFLIVYFSLIFVVRMVNLDLIDRIRIKNVLKRFKSKKLNIETTVKDIIKILRKNPKIRRFW